MSALDFGIITTSDCVNVAPPPDTRCQDPAFALANPNICPQAPLLIVKPAVALTCDLGSIQFRAFLVKNNIETDVTKSAIFTSSDLNIAVVGATSGNATGLAPGTATVAAAYQNLNAYAELTVLDTPLTRCCAELKVGMMVMLDTSLSMSQKFNAAYATRLAYGKAAATRFINEVNQTKDVVGLMTFNDVDDLVLAAPTANKVAVAALVPPITQTQQKTSFFTALETAVTELNALSVDRRVIILITDGEDTTTTQFTQDNDPILLLNDFKSQGGIVMVLGVRTSRAFGLLEAMASGGFFVNGYDATAQISLDYLSGLKGYICGGNCAPIGDVFMSEGQLNYSAFINWNVTGGNVDLIGNGFIDLLPGNGLYVDMAGSIAPFKGMLTSKTSFALKANHSYRLSLQLAGNQRIDLTPESVRIRVFSQAATLLDQTVTLNNYTQPFQPYSFTFTAPADISAFISIEQLDTPPGQPAIGVLLNQVTFSDITDLITLLDDNFDGENLTYVPPRCGFGTTPLTYATSNQYTLSPEIPFAWDICSSNTTPNAGSGLRFHTLSPNTIVAYSITNPVHLNFPDAGGPIDNVPDQIQIVAYLSDQPDPCADAGYGDVVIDQRTDLTWTPGETKFFVVQNPGEYQFYNLNTDQNAFIDNTPVLELHLYSAAEIFGGVSYGARYAYGYNCDGIGCLAQPPAAQSPDPSPLPDIESGFTPPKTFNSTKQACVTCPAGQVNLSTTNLVPVMTSDTTPSGVASASSEVAPAWQAFDGSPSTVWASSVGVPAWLQYQFAAAQTVVHYSITIFKTNESPRDFTVQASNDGLSWTTLDAKTGLNWFPGETKQFIFTNAVAYTFYRLNITATNWNMSDPHSAAIAEWQLFAAATSPVCATASASSPVSQADADALATSAATVAANVLLNCATVYTATEQYTATCPFGEFGQSVTQSATASSLNSLQEAQDSAGALAKAAAMALLDCTQSNNTQTINIVDGPPEPAAANPYPTVKYVTGMTGHVTKVTVSVHEFGHQFPPDVHILLRAPSGELCILMANAGDNSPGTSAVTGLDFIFDDAAGGQMPQLAQLTAGTFKPSAFDPGSQLDFPSPCPAHPYGTTLAIFNGIVPNGSWSLWVCDDTFLDTGIIKSWDLTITSA